MVLVAPLNTAWGEEPTRFTRLQDIAYRQVMFEQYQGQHRNAYIVADYYQRRGAGSVSIRLAQAAASLEMGYLKLGRTLLADLQASPVFR